MRAEFNNGIRQSPARARARARAMDVADYQAAFGVLLCATFLVDLASGLLNRAWLSRSPPPELAEVYDADEYRAAQTYNRETSSVSIASQVGD